MVKDIHDVIAHAKFGDDRLRGSGVVAGQISAFPIDFAGRPYNTLTLPCERVMYLLIDGSGRTRSTAVVDEKATLTLRFHFVSDGCRCVICGQRGRPQRYRHIRCDKRHASVWSPSVCPSVCPHNAIVISLIVCCGLIGFDCT